MGLPTALRKNDFAGAAPPIFNPVPPVLASNKQQRSGGRPLDRNETGHQCTVHHRSSLGRLHGVRHCGSALKKGASVSCSQDSLTSWTLRPEAEMGSGGGLARGVCRHHRQGWAWSAHSSYQFVSRTQFGPEDLAAAAPAVHAGRGGTAGGT